MPKAPDPTTNPLLPEVASVPFTHTTAHSRCNSIGDLDTGIGCHRERMGNMYKKAGLLIGSAYRELLRRATTTDAERYQPFVAMRAFGRVRETTARRAEGATTNWKEDHPPVMCITCM